MAICNKNTTTLIVCANAGQKRTQICQATRLALNSNSSCANFCKQLFDRKLQNVYFVDCSVLYKISDFADLERELALTSISTEGFCFIIEDIEKMSPAVANRLLKKLEEPPQYVHFVLTTNNEDLVLPTIKSRCNRISRPANIFTSDSFSKNHQDLVIFFLQEVNINKALELDKLLKEVMPDEISSRLILEEIINKASQSPQKETSIFPQKLAILTSALADLPQSGCNNFWRYLFIKLL